MKNVNNSIIDNSNALREKINEISPGIIQENMQELLPRRNCTDTQFLLTRQYMIDDLADLLEENHLVNILYARRTKEKRCYEAIAYSMPCDGEMYVIKIFSKMYGATDTLLISFYQSLDIMFLDLRTLYQTADNEKWVLLEKQKPYVFFANFK